MNSQDKSSQQNVPAKQQVGSAQGSIGPGEANAAARKQQPGGPHQPAHFSQQAAQKIPSDPDPDDPVSP
ncbi:MAG TPA: hypothetical protein VJ652_15630 [Noviherbaspirillum sp.]|nr:hypothetical protein [Noviherbaspirillum sp.]